MKNVSKLMFTILLLVCSVTMLSAADATIAVPSSSSIVAASSIGAVNPDVVPVAVSGPSVSISTPVAPTSIPTSKFVSVGKKGDFSPIVKSDNPVPCDPWVCQWLGVGCC